MFSVYSINTRNDGLHQDCIEQNDPLYFKIFWSTCNLKLRNCVYLKLHILNVWRNGKKKLGKVRPQVMVHYWKYEIYKETSDATLWKPREVKECFS